MEGYSDTAVLQLVAEQRTDLPTNPSSERAGNSCTESQGSLPTGQDNDEEEMNWDKLCLEVDFSDYEDDDIAIEDQPSQQSNTDSHFTGIGAHKLVQCSSNSHQSVSDGLPSNSRVQSAHFQSTKDKKHSKLSNFVKEVSQRDTSINAAYKNSTAHSSTKSVNKSKENYHKEQQCLVCGYNFPLG